jgi:glycosyltransferase involved in cell wall biosynthesis
MEEILRYIKSDVKIIWVGKGDDEDNKILEKLEKTDKRFKFTGCSFEEMQQYYSRADIVIIPTIASEGTSLSCIEAFACGCAVVATNVGGLCNLVVDNYNGLIVNPNPKDISEATTRLIDDKELRLKLVRNAK